MFNNDEFNLEELGTFNRRPTNNHFMHDMGTPIDSFKNSRFFDDDDE